MSWSTVRDTAKGDGVVGRWSRRSPDGRRWWLLPLSRDHPSRITSLRPVQHRALAAVGVLHGAVGSASVVAGVLALIVTAFTGSSESGLWGFPDVPLVGLLLIASGFFSLMYATSGLFVTDEEVVVLNLLRHHTIRPEAVSDVSVGQSWLRQPCIVLHLTDGRTIKAHYAGSTATRADQWSLWRGHTSKMADETQQLAQRLRQQFARNT